MSELEQLCEERARLRQAYANIGYINANGKTATELARLEFEAEQLLVKIVYLSGKIEDILKGEVQNAASC